MTSINPSDRSRRAAPPGRRVRPVRRMPARRTPRAVVASALIGAALAVVPAGPAGAAGLCAAPSTTIERSIPWAQHRLAADRVWNLTRGGGVTVAVLDSGVDASVPQLAGNVLAGVDVVAGGKADSDCLGHGTSVAGIIAARPVKGIGFSGVAPGVKILPIRQTEDRGRGTAAGMATAIVEAVDRGADVINISATATSPSPALEQAVQYAESRDVVIVASAANEASRGNPRTYPASYDSVIAVGSIDVNGARSDYSETGDFIDLVAPGSDVLTLGTGGPGHGIQDGTSFAAPFVAGVAALVRSYRPELTAAQVRQRIEATADHPGRVVPDAELGHGVVNPYTAVTAVLPGEHGSSAQAAPPPPVSRPAPPAGTDQAVRTALGIGGGSLAIIVMLALGATVIPRGRRRSWTPG